MHQLLYQLSYKKTFDLQESKSNLLLFMIHRLNVPRKEGGKELASIEDSINTSMRRLEDYIKKSKLLRDFEIQTNHLNSTRWPDLVTDNNFTVPADNKVKIKESKKNNEYLDLAREQKKMEHEGDEVIICSWCSGNNPQRTGKGTGRLGNKRTRKYHPDYSIIKNSQNTERGPEDLRRLAGTQTAVRNYQQTLVWKTFEIVK